MKVKEFTLNQLAEKGCLFKDGAWVSLKDQDKTGEVRLIQLADIREWVFRNRSCRFLSLDRVKSLKGVFVKKGDILIARLPSPVGRACVFPCDDGKYMTINDVVVFRNVLKGLDTYYLCYCLNSPIVRSQIAALHSGSMRGRISKQKLGTVKFPPLRDREA